ncbi:hypothetical protein FRUB_01474 [Fimbriiglobus ruber]|uniref:Uncharacterized protein n=1 Tax=Fimbriiglobus ruber TaxID=1908690 RepID=A0A225DVU1_9BACT|nr:hypothetical protein FRUB_01474 [Fimbriiglobus ruber]
MRERRSVCFTGRPAGVRKTDAAGGVAVRAPRLPRVTF